MSTPRVPLNVLIRTLRPVSVAMDALAQFNAEGDLVVDLPDRQLIYRPMTREALVEQFGAERIGEIKEAWMISDHRLLLVRPSGLTVEWVETPGTLDRLARIALDLCRQDALPKAA